MSFTLYTLFYNKFLKPSTQYRFSCLTFVFLFYLFFGSYIFLLLNANAEYVERLRLSMFIQDFYDEHECLDEVDTREYLDFLINASNKKGIVLGQDGTARSTGYEPNWEFSGETIFFTFTLLSTIGYGYLTPVTDAGKLFCVFYCLIGVPVTFLVFYSIADHVETFITKKNTMEYIRSIQIVSESRYSDYYYLAQKHLKKLYMKCFFVGFGLFFFVYVLPSILFTHLMEYPHWSFLDALYFCYISISTIGFGDFIPGRGMTVLNRNNYRLFMTVYLFFGIIFNIVFSNILMNLPVIRKLNNLMGNNPHNYSILNQTYESDRDHDGASENERFSVNVASNIQANDE